MADLIEPSLDKGYHLYIDNWYTSVPLLKFLFDHSTLACGTIRSNRKGFPDPVKKAKLKKGQVKSYRSSELVAMKFKDKREVLMLTTIHNEEMVPGLRLPAHHKPRCIADYNKYMGGVDRTDQLMQPYDMARKSLKWYKKLACHFLQLAMLNSFLVNKKDRGQKRFLEFQHDVISVLLFGTENDQPDIPRGENVLRLTERHFLEQIPPTANKRKAQKRCRVRYKIPFCLSSVGPIHKLCVVKFEARVVAQSGLRWTTWAVIAGFLPKFASLERKFYDLSENIYMSIVSEKILLGFEVFCETPIFS